MSILSHSDFAQLLDDLIKASEIDEPQTSARPAMPFDFLVDTQKSVAGETSIAEAEYFDAVEALDRLRDVPSIEGPELPSLDPEEVAAELNIAGVAGVRELDTVRRDFAFRNHPDRVAPELRDRAMKRMQIANQLIDEAKRRARPQ